MSHSPFICPQSIQKIRAISPEDNGLFLREILALSAQDIQARIARLDAALRQGNAPAAIFEAHSIKGAALTVGAFSLAGYALRIEQEVRQGDPARLLGLCAQLREEFVPVGAALAEIT